jgi:hypothetical protein
VKNIKFLKTFSLILVSILAAFSFENSNAEILCALGVMVTPDIKRGYLALFVDWIKKNYPGFSNISEMDLRPYNIRLLQDLKANGTAYKFDPKNGYKGSNANLPAFEKLLDADKLFFGSELRVAVRKIDANGQLGPVFTYEDKAHFDASGEIEALHALYNGHTSLTTDNVKRITDFANDQFRVVPAQQKEELTDVVVFWPEYGPGNDKRGYISLAPTPIIDSKKTNQIEVNLIGGTAAIEGATGKKNILQIDILGWIFDPASGGQGFCGGF